MYKRQPFITDRLSSSGSGTFEPEDLPVPCRYILDRAAPGGTYSETFPLSDCCDHWPFFVDEGFSEIGRGLDELLSGELAQPVPEDTVVEASVTLNTNGEVREYSCNIISLSLIHILKNRHLSAFMLAARNVVYKALASERARAL